MYYIDDNIHTTLLNTHTLNDGSLMAAPAPYLNLKSGPPIVDSKKVELNLLHRSTEISNTFVSYYMEGIWAGHSSGLMALGPL